LLVFGFSGFTQKIVNAVESRKRQNYIATYISCRR
jgi:hypothetical protein